METKDSERYYNSFIQELKDYNDLSSIDFFIKYCASGTEENYIKKDYEMYFKNMDIEDKLDYEEWLEKVFYEENQDDINDRIKEYFESLNIITYINEKDSEDKIYDILLTSGGPNVYLIINTKYGNGEYNFHWGSEHLSINIDRTLCETYCSILGLDY